METCGGYVVVQVDPGQVPGMWSDLMECLGGLRCEIKVGRLVIVAQ